MKQILKPENYERLSKFIGDPDQPFKFKSLFTAIVWSPNDREASLENITHNNIIVMNAETPKFPDDYFFYRWLRKSSRSVFMSGKMIRSLGQAPSPMDDLQGNEDIEKYCTYFGTDQVQKQKQYVISQHLTVADVVKLNFFKRELNESVVFKTKAMKQSDLEDESFKQYAETNSIQIAPFQQSVRDALQYAQKNQEQLPMMIDMGPEIVGDVLDLIQYMVITLYRGSLSQQFIGQEMPKMSLLLTLFDVVFESEEMTQHQGFIKVFVMIRKQ